MSSEGEAASQQPWLDRDRADWTATRRELLVIFSLAATSLVVALDATVIVPALATLARELNGNALETFWAGTSYLLSFAVSQPLIANLSDHVGRRIALLVSISIFTIGTIVCCVACSFTQLLPGRVVQGIGGGGILTLSNVIFADIIPTQQRGKYISYIQLVWALGTIIGPIIGGLFVQHTTWRWIFYVNFPFIPPSLILVCLLIPEPCKIDLSVRKLFLTFDHIGALLCIVGTTLFLVSLTWAGTQFPWASAATIVPLVCGALLMIGAIVWTPREGTHPFLNKALFLNRTSIAIYLCAFCQGIILYGEMYYISLYLEGVKVMSAVQTGAGLLAIGLTLVPSSMATAIWISKSLQYCYAIWTGAALSVLANGLLLIWNENTSTAVWAVILVIVGLGSGMLLSSLNLAAQAACELRFAPTAAGFFTFVRSIGMAFGVALGGTVLQNVLDRQVAAFDLPEDFATDVTAYVALMQVIRDPVLLHNYSATIGVGLRAVFGVITGVCGLAFLISLLMQRKSFGPRAFGVEDGAIVHEKQEVVHPPDDINETKESKE